MSVTIVQLDIEHEKELLHYICKYLFKEWGDNYINRYSVNNVSELVKFYEKTPQLALFVALDDDGNFRGCYSMAKKGDLYWLSDMYVVPKYRKQGVGKMLVNHALKDNTKVALYTTEATISYYELFGFERGMKFQGTDLKGDTFEFFSMLYKPTSQGYDHSLVISILALIGLGILLVLWMM